jgi:hypothetical protein
MLVIEDSLVRLISGMNFCSSRNFRHESCYVLHECCNLMWHWQRSYVIDQILQSLDVSRVSKVFGSMQLWRAQIYMYTSTNGSLAGDRELSNAEVGVVWLAGANSSVLIAYHYGQTIRTPILPNLFLFATNCRISKQNNVDYLMITVILFHLKIQYPPEKLRNRCDRLYTLILFVESGINWTLMIWWRPERTCHQSNLG